MSWQIVKWGDIVDTNYEDIKFIQNNHTFLEDALHNITNLPVEDFSQQVNSYYMFAASRSIAYLCDQHCKFWLKFLDFF